MSGFVYMATGEQAFHVYLMRQCCFFVGFSIVFRSRYHMQSQYYQNRHFNEQNENCMRSISNGEAEIWKLELTNSMRGDIIGNPELGFLRSIKIVAGYLKTQRLIAPLLCSKKNFPISAHALIAFL